MEAEHKTRLNSNSLIIPKNTKYKTETRNIESQLIVELKMYR